MGSERANYNNSDNVFFNFRDPDFGFTLRRLEKFTKEQKEWIILVYSEQCKMLTKLLCILSKEGIKIGCTLYICLLEWPYLQFEKNILV